MSEISTRLTFICVAELVAAPAIAAGALAAARRAWPVYSVGVC